LLVGGKGLHMYITGFRAYECDSNIPWNVPTSTGILLKHIPKSKVHTLPEINKGWCVTLWPCHVNKGISLRQPKNYGNSIISPCKNIIFKNNPLRETKILQHIITLELISSFNTKSKYHLSNILISK
jgi:hypothetical protein